MERLPVAVALVVVAVLVAVIVDRRRPAPPTQPRWAAPTQVDRADFDGPDLGWLVAVFTSATCDSCRDVVAKARVLVSDQVGFQEIAWQDRKDLHERYAVDVVPTTVVADRHGVVRASFVGAPTATDLWAALADARATDEA